MGRVRSPLPAKWNVALRDALRPIALRLEPSVSAVAIAWALSWPGVTATIVGARSPEQMDICIGAANLKLTPADLEEIAGAIERTGAGNRSRLAGSKTATAPSHRLERKAS